MASPLPLRDRLAGVLIADGIGIADAYEATDAALARLYDLTWQDDAPTAKLPPITDTVRRRPPPPRALSEMKGAELLHAILDAIEADPDTAGEDL